MRGLWFSLVKLHVHRSNFLTCFMYFESKAFIYLNKLYYKLYSFLQSKDNN